MPALGGPMTYLNEERVTPIDSSSSSPLAAAAAAPSSSSRSAAYLSPSSQQHYASRASSLSASTIAASQQRHRPFSSSASSTSSDFSLDSAASNNSHLLLPPLPQQPPSSLYSKPPAMASYSHANMSYVSHQCPRTGTAFTVQAGQQCTYCNYVVQGYYQQSAQSSQSQPWPPQQYQQQQQQPPQPQPPYTTSPQQAYYVPSAGQGSYPSPGGAPNYTYKAEPGAVLQYQTSPSPTHMDYAIAHSNQQNQCPHCQRVLGRNADLDRHIESVHTRSKQYQCKYETCDRHTRPFNRYDHLRDHLRKVHGEQIVKTRGPRSSRNQS